MVLASGALAQKIDEQTLPEDAIPFELQSLLEAVRYQQWLADSVRPWLGERILEIGAGLGSMSRWLPARERLIVTESDPGLLERLTENTREWFDPADDSVSVERFDPLRDPPDRYVAEKLDTIVSFNVLEHIEDDVAAFACLSRILREGRAEGARRLVTLVPAHPWAYGTVDAGFGHFRRYSGSRIREIAQEVAPEARLVVRHLNAVGLVGWLLNGRVLRRRALGSGAVRAFERLCPLIRAVDDALHRLLRLPLGQSLIAVWEWDGASPVPGREGSR
jgi:SAM-dependent methyltransferase